MKPITILCESRVDFKYKSIFLRLGNIKLVEGAYLKLLRKFLKGRNLIYHIRYLKFRGYATTPMRILLVFLLCKITKSKLIWSCHNLYEHNIESKRYNDRLRGLLGNICDGIIVFHKDLLNGFPKKLHHKIHVACFGNLRQFIENQDIENNDFQEKYSKWVSNLKSSGQLDLISVSAAKRNNLEYLIKGASSSNNVLIIAPNQELDTGHRSNHIFVYDNFVRKEIHDILIGTNGLIGFIGHENVSVPTSIYMYASYGIPVIGLNVSPVNTIIKEFQLGEVIDDSSMIEQCVQKIRSDYIRYSNSCKVFLDKNSWELSANVHSKVFV